jgi:signal transduction histidine kinase
VVGVAGGAVLGCGLVAGTGSLWLIWYLDRHRGSPGAGWFIATLSAQALWTFAYAGGLLVFDPARRAALEAAAWVGMVSLGPLFLGFALRYTGRGHLLRSAGFRATLAVPAATAVLAATHPFHDLLWRNFRLAPALDLAVVQYAIQPPGYAAVIFGLTAAGVGVLLLVESILDYGPLYRREAAAVALSTVPPSAGLLVWLTNLGPWPGLNLALVLLVPHVALDAYAFVGTHMFETNPTTQRAAERSALEDLTEPLLVVDTDDRVVNLNERAAVLFDVDRESALPLPLAQLTGTGLDELRSSGEVTLDGTEGGVFAVSYTPLSGPQDVAVGGIVVLYDVTAERRRKQQLSVLNRVLRHNLRNEMTIIRGNARTLASGVSEPTLASQAEMVTDSSERLLAIADKARDFARVQERAASVTAVDLEALLEAVRDEVRDSHPDAVVDLEVELADPEVRTDRTLLSLSVTNLVENALVHAETPAPEVTVRATQAGRDGLTAIEVCDDNPPIPDDEVSALGTGGETPLRHGSGIGLWIVTWCLASLDGTVEFAYDGGNVVTVTIPTVPPDVAADGVDVSPVGTVEAGTESGPGPLSSTGNGGGTGPDGDTATGPASPAEPPGHDE